ncbi:MAG: hypothetical protein HQL23_05530 [Candidatus Omnitrophica bacterium]|nr:hypothetical protein [Candidatus Omnitrophota bacterium]
MKKIMNFKLFLIGLLISGFVAVAASYLFKVTFLISFGIAFFVTVLNSIIAEHEDNSRGGFNNPDNNKRNK